MDALPWPAPLSGCREVPPCYYAVGSVAGKKEVAVAAAVVVVAAVVGSPLAEDMRNTVPASPTAHSTARSSTYELPVLTLDTSQIYWGTNCADPCRIAL